MRLTERLERRRLKLRKYYQQRHDDDFITKFDLDSPYRSIGEWIWYYRATHNKRHEFGSLQQWIAYHVAFKDRNDIVVLTNDATVRGESNYYSVVRDLEKYFPDEADITWSAFRGELRIQLRDDITKYPTKIANWFWTNFVKYVQDYIIYDEDDYDIRDYERFEEEWADCRKEFERCHFDTLIDPLPDGYDDIIFRKICPSGDNVTGWFDNKVLYAAYDELGYIINDED